MARPLRFNVAGGFYHLIQRGNYRQDLFLGDRDREAFVERMGEYARIFECRIHAYCLMTNHLHLLVETLRPNLSAFGQRLFGSYTLWFNRKHRRVGHLFQGRFKAALVEKESHWAEMSRYIHLNPARAGMTKKPEDYRWSSLKAYARPGAGEPWVYRREILGRMDGDRKAYLDYVYEGIGKAWKPSVTDRVFVGSEEFVRKMKAALGWRPKGRRRPARGMEAKAEGRARQAIRLVAEAFGVDPDRMARPHVKARDLSDARGAAMYVLRRGTTLTCREIGRLLGSVGPTAVLHGVSRTASRPALLRRAEACRKRCPGYS